MAFQNVADTLHAIEADARTLKAAGAAENAAMKSLNIVRKQLLLGPVNLQTLLTRIQARVNRYADTAALFQPVGGGWWNREGVSPKEPLDLAECPTGNGAKVVGPRSGPP